MILKQEIILYSIKNLRETNGTLRAEVVGSLSEFDVKINDLQVDYTNSINNSVKATIQKPYDVGIFDIDDKDRVFKEYITFDKRRERELEKK